MSDDDDFDDWQEAEIEPDIQSQVTQNIQVITKQEQNQNVQNNYEDADVNLQINKNELLVNESNQLQGQILENIIEANQQKIHGQKQNLSHNQEQNQNCDPIIINQPQQNFQPNIQTQQQRVRIQKDNKQIYQQNKQDQEDQQKNIQQQQHNDNQDIDVQRNGGQIKEDTNEIKVLENNEIKEEEAIKSNEIRKESNDDDWSWGEENQQDNVQNSEQPQCLPQIKQQQRQTQQNELVQPQQAQSSKYGQQIDPNLALDSIKQDVQVQQNNSKTQIQESLEKKDASEDIKYEGNEQKETVIQQQKNFDKGNEKQESPNKDDDDDDDQFGDFEEQVIAEPQTLIDDNHIKSTSDFQQIDSIQQAIENDRLINNFLERLPNYNFIKAQFFIAE